MVENFRSSKVQGTFWNLRNNDEENAKMFSHLSERVDFCSEDTPWCQFIYSAPVITCWATNTAERPTTCICRGGTRCLFDAMQQCLRNSCVYHANEIISNSSECAVSWCETTHESVPVSVLKSILPTAAVPRIVASVQAQAGDRNAWCSIDCKFVAEPKIIKQRRKVQNSFVLMLWFSTS